MRQFKNKIKPPRGPTFYSPGVLEIFLLYFFKVLGLAPLSVKILKTNPKNISSNFSTSRTGSIYIIILILTVIPVSVSMFHLIEEKHETDKANSGGIGHTFRISKIAAGIVVTFMIWCSMIFNQERSIRILTQLMVTDNGIKMYSNLFKLDSSRFFIFFIFLLSSVLWIILCTVEYILYDNVNVWICILLPNYVIMWYTMQYGFMLILLAKRFENLNSAFIKLSKSRLEPLFLRSSLFDAHDNEDVSDRRTIADNFHGLRQAYTMYSEVCKKLADYYSVPILFSIAWFSCEIVYCLYFVVLSFIFEDAAQPIVTKIGLIIWLIYFLLPIFTLTRSVTAITNEMKTTGGIVYKLLAQSVVAYAAKEELNIFWLELLHRNVNFTAYGVLSLDSRLIQSIFGNCCTFLIILVQFQVNARKKTQ